MYFVVIIQHIFCYLKICHNNRWIDGVEEEVMIVYRYVAAEIAPTYSLTKNISVGLYYLNGHGLDKGAIKYSHFVSLRSGFSNIKLTDKFYLRFNPQVYYLRMDENDGFYFTSTLTLAKKDFPLSVSSLISTPFQTTIPQDKNLIWNVSLTYSFNKEYVEK